MAMLFHAVLFTVVFGGAVLYGIRRVGFRAAWQPRSHDGANYEFAIHEQKGRKLGLLLRYAVPKGPRFFVRRENWFDRLGKRLRVAVEPQLGSETFDERYYLDCPDPERLRELREQPELMKVLRGFEARMSARRLSLHEIRCIDGHFEVWLEGPGAERTQLAEETALAWLAPLLDALRAMPPRADRQTDSTVVPRLVFVAFWGIGLIGGALVSQFFSERLLAPGALFWASLPWSLAALALALAWSFRAIGPTARRHRVLGACLLVGIPGFALTGFLVARTLDLSLPQGPPEVFPVTEARLGESYRRKRGTVYHVAFHTDDRRVWGVSGLELSRQEYDRLRATWGADAERDATLLRYPGALGAPWVVVDVVAAGGQGRSAAQ